MDSGNSWRRLLVALLIALVANVESGQLSLSFPQSRKSLIQVAELQLCHTLTLLGFAIGNFFIGYLVDRFGVTKSLVFASLLISANFLFCALSKAYFQLYFPTSFWAWDCSRLWAPDCRHLSLVLKTGNSSSNNCQRQLSLRSDLVSSYR